jgi:hypothetical protein
MLLNYGQPIHGVMQFAYTVPDIEAAIDHYVRVYKIGPWTLFGPFSPPQALYRGQPTSLTISLAMAFTGGMMIELVQQHDDGPSVYRETLERTGGYGFHHHAIVTDDYEAETRRYADMGYEMAFFDILQGGRIAYFDTTRDLPGMTELIELTPTAEARQSRVWRSSLGWDGSDPIRRASLAPPPAL